MSMKSTRSNNKRKAEDDSTSKNTTKAQAQAQAQPPKRSKTESNSKPESASNPKSPSTPKLDAESSTDEPPTTSTPSKLQLVEEAGDIFSAPKNTLLIHSCNCAGSWGGGIAKAFAQKYPHAYKSYNSHCSHHDPSELVGKAQLIPPSESGKESKHFVGCLFTSRHYGRKRDSPAQILRATGPAMRDLLRKVGEWNEGAEEGERVEEVRMCRINSGLFAVPWEKTKEVLEGLDAGGFDVKVVKVVSPPGSG